MSSADVPPALEPRPFGAVGESVSPFGLGLGALTQDGAAAPWAATLAAALELGVHVVDAAPREARIESEALLGEALGERRDEVFLSTRCSPLDGRPFDTSPAAIRTQLESSLRRLRTDRVDLYQVHDVEAAQPRRIIEDALPELLAARERGEVRYIGASGGSLEILIDLVETFPIDAILTYQRLDLIDATLRDRLLPLADERGVAVLNASPLHSGLLANAMVVERAEAADNAIALPTRRAFEIAASVGSSLARLALAFAASEPRVATTLVGCRTVDELRRNVRDFSTPPTSAELEAIEAIRAVFREPVH